MIEEKLNQEELNDVVEAYRDDCGDSDAAYACKRDCIFFWNALFSAIH
ncbi:MAG: hypothetical protein J6U23_00480 [Clostridiales bacterium]|nr:hypothetical protein [Clostridiales bacterium]